MADYGMMGDFCSHTHTQNHATFPPKVQKTRGQFNQEHNVIQVLLIVHLKVHMILSLNLKRKTETNSEHKSIFMTTF